MELKEIIEKLELKVLNGVPAEGREVGGGYVSDLLSDVMGHASAGQIWITLQSHLNVVAIGSLKELSAILFVQGIQPAEDVIARANEEGIPLLGSGQDTFTLAGRLYQILVGK